MKNRRPQILAVAVALSGYAGLLGAAYVVEAPKTDACNGNGQRIVEKKDNLTEYVVYSGTPDTAPTIVFGFGRDVETIQALKQVVPDGWHAYVNKTVTLPARVSWKGGRPWTEIIDGVARELGLTFMVSWDKKTVDIVALKSGVVTTSTVECDPIGSPAATKAAASAETAANAAPAIITPEPEPELVWEITPKDVTIRKAIERMAPIAGWQIAWELPIDFEVQATSTYKGSFENMISEISHSLEMGGNPVQMVFYDKNKILRITKTGARSDEKK